MTEIISNVESVTAAAKIVSAQKVETSQLCIDGKDLQALKEERVPSYKELVTRMELPEDEIWALYTDNGDIVYWHNADKMDTNLANYAFEHSGFNQLPKGLNYEKMVKGYYTFCYCKNLTKVKQDFPALDDGRYMFQFCSNLKSFEGNLSNLQSGLGMFYNCSSLTSFMCKLKADDAEYSPLTSGINMFHTCKLDAPSVENILTSLQPFTDGSEHIMTIKIQSAAVEKFNEITGNTLTLNSTYQNVPFRGWTVQVAII